MESSHTTLPWSQMLRAAPRQFRSLAQDTKADVVIVGAGVAGMTTALMLARHQVDVVVLDDGPVGGGETERTTAHLASALDDRFVKLEKNHGVGGSHLAWQSHSTAIDVIEGIVEEEGIDCSFARLDGWLFCSVGDSTQLLQDELEAARRAGFVDVEMFDRIPELMWDTGAVLRFPRQGQLHPLRYLQGLTAAFTALGGRIHTSSHVAGIEGGAHPGVLTTSGKLVQARAVVVATNTPINDRFVIHTKQQAYRSYVVALRLDDVVVPALLWDTSDPYHYVRVAEGIGPGGSDLLIVGGEDHKTGHADDADARWARLHHWASERFPAGNVVHRWSGQIMEPVDGLAFIGKNPGGPDNVFIATGDSGHGLTHGTIAGMILSDLVRGIDHPWAALYEPSRKPSHALGEFARENLESVSHYAQYVLPADVDDIDDIGRGDGAVVREGLALYAASCSEHGLVRKCSAVCPHLGGIVSYNSAERSWDCPVHGSRFDLGGVVVNGPANANLKQIDQLQPELVIVDELKPA